MTGPDVSGPDVSGPDTVEVTLEALYQQARTAWEVVQRDSDGLSLAGTGDALEVTVDVLDLVWSVVRAVVTRTESIREREVNDRRRAETDVVDLALVHLHYGQEGLMVARHLLGAGRGEVLRVTQGKV
ncbi:MULTISPECIES: hypothetical protein [Actinomadura]|uniref:Uncharacterized protein n=1 Tax=Actinomadura luteofluorescens TaxID=46163 RepID=A0A7Y9JDV5_9ACTN|nr:hypothetical protein [Actinomadura luteofluorescens]NYD44781.1 hypothetical protein [Actinomadura luteofluorescens]